MPSTWQEECVRERVRSFRNEIARVADKDHPYPEPSIILMALVHVLNDRESTFDEVLEFQRGDPIAIQNAYKAVADSIERIWQMFSLVDRVDSSRIPFEMLRSLAWAGKDLLDEDCRVVVRIDPLYNYTITSVSQAFAVEHWEAELRAVTEGTTLRDAILLLLGLPSPETRSILLHVLAAHELGHVHYGKFRKSLDSAISKVSLQLRGEYRSRLEDYINDYMNVRYRPFAGVTSRDLFEEYRRQAELRIAAIVQSWGRESYADLVAARLVGPAYLAALDKVLLGNEPASDDHPSALFRRRLVLRYLEKHFPDVASDPVWSKLNDSAPQVAHDDPLLPYAEAVCEQLVDEFLPFLESVKSPFAVENGRLEELCSLIQTHIMNLSPPSVALREFREWCTASGFWLLLYAAWRFRLNSTEFEAFKARYGWHGEPSTPDEVLDNLLLHSLQSLELCSLMNAQRHTERR